MEKVRIKDLSDRTGYSRHYFYELIQRGIIKKDSNGKIDFEEVLVKNPDLLDRVVFIHNAEEAVFYINKFLMEKRRDGFGVDDITIKFKNVKGVKDTKYIKYCQ